MLFRLRKKTTLSKPKATPSPMLTNENAGMGRNLVPLVVVVTVVVFAGKGYNGSTSGARGLCVKSKSCIKSPKSGEFSRTSGLESGLPSLFGSRR